MAKEKEIRKPLNWKKEAKLLPGYVICSELFNDPGHLRRKCSQLIF